MIYLYIVKKIEALMSVYLRFFFGMFVYKYFYLSCYNAQVQLVFFIFRNSEYPPSKFWACPYQKAINTINHMH